MLAECFVREFEPVDWSGRTIVMAHGFMHTGEHYVRTIDGRPGWAHDFAAAGYRVLVPDWPGVGRSPVIEPSLFTSDLMTAGLAGVVDSVTGPVDLLVHSMSGPYGISLLESHGDRIDHLVAIAPGQPPEIVTPPDVIEEVGDEIRTVYAGIEFRMPKEPDWMIPSREFVVDKCIGTSTRFPTVDPQAYLDTLVPMWGGLGHERLAAVCVPKDSRPMPSSLTGRRVLVMSGSHDRDHTRESDGQLVEWLRSRGAAVTFDYLADRGIVGNSHMLMLDDNSAELAGLILEWLAAE